MNEHYRFTDKEKKLRKNWLISLWLLVTIEPVLMMILFLYAHVSLMAIGILLSAFIPSILGCWLIIHCAYKKHGYRLLTFQLIVSPLLFPPNIAALRSGFQALMLILLVLFVWWYKNSWQLRKLNKKIRTLLPKQTAFNKTENQPLAWRLNLIYFFCKNELIPIRIFCVSPGVLQNAFTYAKV